MTTEFHQVPSQQPFYATNSDLDPWLITATSNLNISWSGKKTKTKRELPSSPPSLFGADEVPWSPPAFPPPSSYARIKKPSSTEELSAQPAEEDPWLVQDEEEDDESTKDKDSTIEDEISGQNLYKTELCRSFVETGACRYGFKCQFAHGKNELRPVLRHPKYKTEICKTFHSTGTCPYGIRCRFIHTKSTEPASLLIEGTSSASPSPSPSPSISPSPSPPAVVPSKWSTSWTPRVPKTKGDDDDVPDSPPTSSKKRLAIFRALC